MSPGAGDDNFVDLSLYCAASAGGDPNLDGLRPACTGEKGIHFRAWGSLLGQLLLRSVDRAHLVYESMMLRGYGWRDDPAPTRQPQKGSAAGTVFFVATLMYCILFRVIPIFELLGQLF